MPVAPAPETTVTSPGAGAEFDGIGTLELARQQRMDPFTLVFDSTSKHNCDAKAIPTSYSYETEEDRGPFSINPAYRFEDDDVEAYEIKAETVEVFTLIAPNIIPDPVYVNYSVQLYEPGTQSIITTIEGVTVPYRKHGTFPYIAKYLDNHFMRNSLNEDNSFH